MAVKKNAGDLDFLSGGGEMGARIRSHDWSSTLGPPSDWPQALHTALSFVLSTRHPMYIWWGPQLICFYNDAYSTSIGPERHPGSLGRPGREVWDEIWPLVGPQIDQVMTGGEPTWLENQLVPISRSGVLQDVYWTYGYGPIHDASAPNHVGGVLVICNETTDAVLSERRRAAEAAARSEIFQQAPGIVIVMAGVEHVVEFVNDTHRKLFRSAEWVGLPIREAFPDIEGQGYFELLDQVLSTGEAYVSRGSPVRFRLFEEAGLETRYLDFTYVPLRNGAGTVTGIFCEGVDVTDRRNAEVALRHSQERFQAAIEVIGVLWTNDASGRMVGSQPGWEQLTGQAEKDYQGYGWSLAVHPGDAEATIAAWEMAVASGTLFRHEHRVRRRDGQWRRFAICALPITESDGIVREWVGVHMDITEATQAEEALRDADRKKDEFIATLAHELRNPLAPVRNAAHLLKLPNLTPEKLGWCADLIGRQVQTMAVLLDDLLDISRITTGRLELRRRHVEINAVVHASIEASRPLLDAKRHSFILDVDDNLPSLDADPVRVEQILSNMLVNAAKYTDAGGAVRMQVRRVGDDVEFQVSDTGIGLRPDTLDSIFSMFSQVHSALDRTEGGLGIGLALTRGLVELHGGSIRADSEGPGKGSTFTVRLPSGVPSAAEATARQVNSPKTNGRLGTVLIVDDNRDAALSMGALLEAAGYEVQVAHDAANCLQISEKSRPDIGLLDLGLPGMSGQELAMRLRSTAWGNEMSLAAVTGWGQEVDRRSTLAAGFDVHFTKPVDPEALLQWLSNARVPS
jgi:PAS domain S-box-containing protein